MQVIQKLDRATEKLRGSGDVKFSQQVKTASIKMSNVNTQSQEVVQGAEGGLKFTAVHKDLQL